MTVKIVMITVLRKKVQKGMVVTASAKFCQTSSWGHSVGGDARISSLVLSVVATIQ